MRGSIGRTVGVVAALLVVVVSCGAQLKSPKAEAGAIAAERDRQREFAVTEWMRRQARVEAVAARIRVAGAELCGDDVGPYLGMSIGSAADFDEELRPVAMRVLGADAKPRILRISPGQPAEQVGLKLREAIVSVDGERVQSTQDVLARVAAHREGGIRLGIEREGREEFVIVTPLVACDYGVIAVADDDVNAFADGDNIGINTGMIRFAENDDELALVIGHEFAHNALGHRARSTTNSVLGALLGGLLDAGVAVVGVNTGGAFSKAGAGLMAGTFSKDFEGEADYLGLYLASRAGYDVGVAPDFWRRMGVEHPASVESKYLSMHPSTPERALSLEQVIAEIRAKREAGEPLEPTRDAR
jgi:hypothetical protein